MDPADLTRRFSAHGVTHIEAERMLDIREFARKLAEIINLDSPDGREKSLAITALEEVVFWANAAIARASTGID
jgi:hypothetical protein